MFLNCDIGEDSWESLGLQGDQTNQSWIFIGRTDAEAEAPILWPPDVKSWLIGKDHGAGKDWRQEEKGKIEDEMVGWHGHEFKPALGDSEGQGNMESAVHGITKSGTWLSDWTTRMSLSFEISKLFPQTQIVLNHQDFCLVSFAN